MEIANLLQTIGYITPELGMTVPEIMEATGMSRATCYRAIESPKAIRWGISRTRKRLQPYSYYVDNDTLLAYQLYYKANAQTEQSSRRETIAFPGDKDRQAVLEMLSSFLKQSVGQFKDPKAIHENFILWLQKPSEAILEDYHTVDKSTSKLILALALAFSHLEE